MLLILPPIYHLLQRPQSRQTTKILIAQTPNFLFPYLQHPKTFIKHHHPHPIIIIQTILPLQLALVCISRIPHTNNSSSNLRIRITCTSINSSFSNTITGLLLQMLLVLVLVLVEILLPPSFLLQQHPLPLHHLSATQMRKHLLVISS